MTNDARAEGELMQVDAKRGPIRHWQVRETHVGMYGWTRWEMSRHGRGVGNCKTPIGAWWRLRRWLKEPASPT